MGRELVLELLGRFRDGEPAGSVLADLTGRLVSARFALALAESDLHAARVHAWLDAHESGDVRTDQAKSKYADSVVLDQARVLASLRAEVACLEDVRRVLEFR